MGGAGNFVRLPGVYLNGAALYLADTQFMTDKSRDTTLSFVAPLLNT